MFGDRHSEPLKATYSLSEVKSFITNYDPTAVGAFDLDFSIAGNDRSDRHSQTSYVYAWCDPLIRFLHW